MENPIIRNGVYLGIISIIIMMAVYLISPETLAAWYVGVFSLIVAIYFMVRSVKDFKMANEGFASFGEALKYAFGTAIVGTIIASLFTYILYNFIDPSLPEVMKETVIAKMENMEGLIGEEAAEIAMEKMENEDFSMGFGKVMLGMASSLIFYFILSLIVAAITKKASPTV